MVDSLMQAYSNNPRRKKLQILGSILLFLVIFAVLLVSYLIVSSRVVAMGRQLQSAKDEIDQLEYINVNYMNEITDLSRIEVMEERAKELGFRAPYPGESYYIPVPGLKREAVVEVPDQSSHLGVDVNVNVPAYHQSLFEWVRERLNLFLEPLREL